MTARTLRLGALAPRARFVLGASFACAIACGGNQGAADHPGAGGGTSDDGAGGRIGSGGAGNGSGGRATGSGGKGSGGGTSTGGVPIVPGPPGCGLEAAAFCEPFDALGSEHGRAGDLDTRTWAAGRLWPQLPTLPVAFPVGPAEAPEGCRDGISGLLLPPLDMLICGPNTGVPSSHAWIATAAQNYGVSSIRPRQPFDFSGRTGKIVFDAELSTSSSLLGFVSVAITEDPTNATSYAIDQNVEGGSVPRNGITFQFSNPCASPGVYLSSIIVMKEYEQSIKQLQGPCIDGPRGQLTHVEIEVSSSQVSVYAGAPGSSPELIQELAIEAPMTRGYVQFNVHNHATIKYSDNPSDPILAWSARFDNVGFDGPVLDEYREYEYADSLEEVSMPIENGTELDYVSIGHLLSGADRPTSFDFEGIDPEGMGRARVAFSFWSLQYTDDEPALLYRWNGGAWTTLSTVVATSSWGAIAISLDIPIEEVVSGKNKLELATENIVLNYPPAVANMDLVLTKD